MTLKLTTVHSDWSMANKFNEINWDKESLLAALYSVLENISFLFCISSIITILKQLMALDITLLTQAKYQMC